MAPRGRSVQRRLHLQVDLHTDRELPGSNGKGFALGSNQSVGSIDAVNYVVLSEPSPGYFVKGDC